MPFKIVQPNKGEEFDDDWHRKVRRILVTGPPNSGKTASSETFPHPLGYIAYPGEQGAHTLNMDGVAIAATWEDTSLAKGLDHNAVVNDIKTTTADILAGKYGDIKCFFGDGLHKLYAWFLAKATGGVSLTSLDFDAKLYSEASKGFLQYIYRVLNSNIDTVVFTVWDGREKDDPDAKDKDTQKHIFPELPGKLAKEIMGEFSVVLYATVQGVGEGAKYRWQTRPLGKVWGAGIKAPIKTTKSIETFVPQDWRLLLPKLTVRQTPPEVTVKSVSPSPKPEVKK